MMMTNTVQLSYPPEFDLAWQDNAACAPVYKETLVDLWYEEDHDFGHRDDTAEAVKARQAAKAKAKKICRSCPVQLECLTFAYENNEPSGIWGGLDKRERTVLRNKTIAARKAA